MVNNQLKEKSEHKSRRDSFKKEKKRKRKYSSSSSSSDRKKSKKLKRKRSSSSSSNSSKERERKKRKKEKKKAKKLLKEAKKSKKKDKKKDEPTDCNDVPLELMEKSKSMAPMTKEEWEKRQSVVRKVYDEETGRHRLIKGDGEVIEEIVSRDRHKNINKQATKGDGDYFQSKISSSIKK